MTKKPLQTTENCILNRKVLFVSIIKVVALSIINLVVSFLFIIFEIMKRLIEFISFAIFWIIAKIGGLLG